MIKHKIALLIPYFGRYPSYLPLYLQHAFSRYLDVIFLSDLEWNFNNTPSNVHHIQCSLHEVTERVFEKTKIEFSCERPYKLCDIKPVYGDIFSDLISDYSYWAYGDCDLIYGSLDNTLENIQFWNYDIISFRKYWTSGSLCICRNDPKITFLYKKNPDLKRILTDSQSFVADEAGPIWGVLESGKPLQECETPVCTFTHLIQREGINWFHEDLMHEWLKPGETLCIDSQGVTSVQTGHKYLAYHFVGNKRYPFFKIPKWDNPPMVYYIDMLGITEHPFTVNRFIRKNIWKTYRLVQKTYRWLRYGKWY